MSTKEFMFNEEKPSKLLLKFCIPAIIGMLINALFNFVDAIFIGQLGTEQMAAASITFPFTMFFIGVGMIFGVGGSSYISRLLGQKNNRRAEKSVSVSVFFSVIISVLLTIFFLLTLTPLLKLFGATGKTLEYAREYMIPYLIGSIFVVLNVTLGNIIRAQGAPFFTMIAMSIGGGLNILLDPLLIFNVGMGIGGAAVATILSRIFTWLLFVWYYKSGKSTVSLSLRQMKPDVEMFKEILKIGIPSFMFQLLTTISTGIINVLASAYGTDAVAGMGIVIRILNIGMFIIFGFSKGFQPIAGYNYGAGNSLRLKRLSLLSMIYATIICLVTTFINYLFSEPLITMFTKSTAVITIAKEALFAGSSVLPTFGVQIILATLFLACGKGKEGGFLSMARQGIFFIPAAFIFSSLFGLKGIYWIQPFSDLLTFISSLILGMMFFKKLSIKSEADFSYAE